MLTQDRIGRGYFAKSGLTFDLGEDRLLLNYDIYHNKNSNYTSSNGLADILISKNPNVFREVSFDAFDAAKTNNLRQEAVATYQKRFSDDKSKKLDFQFGYTKSNSKFDQG